MCKGPKAGTNVSGKCWVENEGASRATVKSEGAKHPGFHSMQLARVTTGG